MRLVLDEHARCEAWLRERAAASGPQEGVCIGWEARGELRAVAMFSEHESGEIRMAVAIDRHGASKPFVRAIFRFPFVQLRARVLTAEVDAVNERSRRLVENAGFVMQGERDGVFGYRMLPSECRFL